MTSPPPVAVQLRQGTPPTPMQRGLLASQVRHPTAPLQNMALLSHFEGEVDVPRLIHAFDTVVRASDVLRSQVIGEGSAVSVRVGRDTEPTAIVDVPLAEAERWAHDRVADPIDVGRCGYDSVILVHDDDSVSWYLALHHAITDATSSMMIFDATAKAYADSGDPVEVGSYYQWWESLEPDARTRRAEQFWRHRIAAPRVGRLYRSVGRPTPHSSRLAIPLDPDLLERTEGRLNDDLGTISLDLSWTTLLVTVASVYLHRVTGADRFAIGLPVHNRGDAQTRALIGPLMEVFPVDVTVETDDTFRTLHRRVSRAVMATLRHARPGTAPPLVDCEAVVNVITRAGHGAFGDVPAHTEWIHAGASDPNHLFRLQLVTYGGGLNLLLDLNAGAADQEHAAVAPDHVRGILRALIDDPDEPLSHRSICTDEELAVLDAWGTGAPPGPTPASVVHQLQTMLSGNDAVVLEQGTTTWTGSDLWSRVIDVAGWLRSQGVGAAGRPSRVGIEMPRTTDAVIAIFATLVAGGSYVPLDPTQPAERRARLVERAGCLLVMSELPPEHVADASSPDVPNAGELTDQAREAYLLYTSGSTGEPKGVPITHAGLARYVQFATDAYVEPGHRPIAPLFSALTFDLTVTSLFVPLLAGGRLVVVTEEGSPGIATVAGHRELTWCKATPSHLELLLRLDPQCHLRTLIVGGEAFHGRLARQLWRTFPDVRIFNEYGPTEAVVGCMIHEVTPDRLGDAADVPIGMPAPGVHLRVVDAGLQQVPIGATGELCISHDGLTTGYLGPGADDSPFVHIDDRRWYRSGDVVRLADRHTLVYHGRIDEQIKVGGIRLEPTEVEEALTAHPGIERAAVRVWTPSASRAEHHCIRCGLPSNVPGVDFDEAGVCDTCHAYERIRTQAAVYFRTLDDLAEIRDRAREQRRGNYDCLHLLSGGKDSTYALYQLVALGFEVYSMTLDNGFISEGAKENVRRSVAELGIDHDFVTSDVMNDVFKDSLERHSNVCHGCYKTIYTLATSRAEELGIPVIVTGLSRGQLFETRLIPQQFRADRFDPDEIDRAVLEARKVYHRVDDGPNRLLDTSVFDADDVFERISYVDFYRYIDVELTEMLTFLDQRAPWVRPADTGRSTNCLINAAGIHNHVTEQGFHNYAIPYAWDVRLGHKTREEAMDELDDELDMFSVADMLEQVGHQPRPRETLTGWIEVHPDSREPQPAELRAFLAGKLPSHAIPSAFVAVDHIPMTTNGKIDTDALPAPTRTHRPGPSLHVSPTTPTESAVVEVYERILGIEPVGVSDDFFELGGDSLAALGMVVDLNERFGVPIREAVVFANTTPRDLAAAIDAQEPHDESMITLEPRPAGQPPALSAAEQSMLFDHLSRPDDVRYNVGHLFRIHGRVDNDRLINAVREVVARHVPLRWTFVEPRRELSPDDAIDVLVRSQPVGVEDLHAAVRRFHLQPFDLDDGPLGRCVVQRIDDGTLGLALIFHHVSVDAGSFDLLWDQIDRVYRGELLEELEIDYADHAAWQARRTASVDVPSWLQEATTTANVDFGPSNPDAANGYVEREMSLTAAELRTGPGATPYATLLAALAVVLRRRADGDEIGIGLTVSSREHALADPLVGLFLNTVPTTVRVDASSTHVDVAARSSSVVADALGARTIPLSRIVSERRRRGLPLPDISILLALEDWSPTRLGALHVDHEVLATGSPVADATFFVQVHDDRLKVSIEHRGELISPHTAERLLDEFESTIRESVARPRARALDAAATRPIGNAIVRGPELAPDDRLLHHIIDEQIARDPAHPAVRLDDDVLTYGELDRRANQLANVLRDRGIDTGSFVGICMGRSVELIVSILGVLRSGAAYVPIDPAYPAERIDFIIDDTQLSAVVTAGATDHLPERIQVVDLGTTRDAPETAPKVDQHVDDLAYVIHTSGSTGRPKGVTVRHRNIAASTMARSDFYANPVERFLLLSSFAFDSSMVGIFWTLCTGGTLVLPSDEAHDDVLRLTDLIDRRRITHLLALPSLYRLMATEAQPSQLATLNTVIVAGESCRAEVVDAHRAACPRAVLSNEYGPTEGTVWSHAYIVDEQYREGPVPIGGPIPGAIHLVLDRDGKPVPSDEPGELYIAGRGIAAGYLDHDDTTAERFVQLDTDQATGGQQVWYRTGDLVRSDAHGRLVFLGRADQQVKLRGFRIEPGEVETVLMGHQQVDEVAVDAREVGGRMHLTAWFVSSSTPTTSDLRDHVASQLPAHMVPTFFVQVEAIPVLPNGKFDRTALPDPEADIGRRPADVIGSDEPRQQLLASIWADVLGVESVGSDDNFFDLGGDSIISLQIVARARRAGIDLRPRDVFEHQTVRELLSASDRSAPVTVESGPVTGEVPLTPVQHWFFEQRFVEPNHWNQSMWLDLDPDTDTDLLVAALDIVREHHDQLRAVFDDESGEPRQRIVATPEPPRVEFVDMGELSGTELDQHATRVESSLDIRTGRVVGLLVCTTDGRPTRMLVTVHHLVIDGISWAPVLEDWATAYEGLVTGEVRRLPARSTSFQHWSNSLSGAAREGRFRESNEFWDAATDDSDADLALRASDANTESAAQTITRTLDVGETERLLRAAGSSSADAVTVEDLLLTAAAIAVPRRLGRSRFTTVLEGHGREDLVDDDADVSRTVGWFTSQFPVTLQVSDADDLPNCLAQVRAQLRKIPERGIGFGVERHLAPESSLRAGELPTTAFNYLGQLDRNFAVSKPFDSVRQLRASIAPTNRRSHLLGLLCVIQDGQLVVTIDHHPDHMRPDTATELADDLINILRSLAGESSQGTDASTGRGGFDLVELSESDMSRLSSLLDQLDG